MRFSSQSSCRACSSTRPPRATLRTKAPAGSCSSSARPRCGPVFAGGRFDLRLPSHLVVTQHHDQPGVVGRVGTLFGQAGVNIATLELDRDVQGGRATMALGLDEAPGADLLAALLGLVGVERIHAVDLAVGVGKGR